MIWLYRRSTGEENTENCILTVKCWEDVSLLKTHVYERKQKEIVIYLHMSQHDDTVKLVNNCLQKVVSHIKTIEDQREDRESNGLVSNSTVTTGSQGVRLGRGSLCKVK